jgi:hypothetical protein
MRSAPLRFLVTALALWAGMRAAILLPGWPGGTARASTDRTEAGPGAAGASRAPTGPVAIATAERGMPVLPPGPAPEPVWRAPFGALPQPAIRMIAGPAPVPPSPSSPTVPAVAPARAAPAAVPAIPFQPPGPGTSRWSVSAWLLVRDEGRDRALAPGGTLGGSQAGARVTYGLGGGFSLSGRAYLPLRRPAGAELAAGLDWRPVAALPFNLLAERRQRLGREGRSAFAVTLYGGASRALTPRLRLDLYGQAGVVGLRSRDLFADGSLRLARRIGPVELGAGAWGAAQPGAARLDAGPGLSWRLPVRDANIRLQADWRFRLAGDAAPRSGAALTLATDF